MMRREFITLLGGAATWPLAARAQRARMRRLGVLMNSVENDPGGVSEMGDLRASLVELGWVEDRNIHIDVRWPGGDLERIQGMAMELVAFRPDVLLARSTPTTAALKREGETIPIVFVNVTEPVEQGFVQNLARPAGSITGTSGRGATGVCGARGAKPGASPRAVPLNRWRSPWGPCRGTTASGPCGGGPIRRAENR